MIRLVHGLDRPESEGIDALIVPVCSLLLLHLLRVMKLLDLLAWLLQWARIESESCAFPKAIVELLRARGIGIAGLERFRRIDGWTEHCLLIDRRAKRCARVESRCRALLVRGHIIAMKLLALKERGAFGGPRARG